MNCSCVLEDWVNETSYDGSSLLEDWERVTSCHVDSSLLGD